jgi:hypothetical protein
MNKMFTSLGRLALLLGADAITLPTSPVHSVEKAGGKIKGKHKVKTEEGRHRREMGKLSYGLKR